MLQHGHHEYSCASMQLIDELNNARYALQRAADDASAW